MSKQETSVRVFQVYKLNTEKGPRAAFPLGKLTTVMGEQSYGHTEHVDELDITVKEGLAQQWLVSVLIPALATESPRYTRSNQAFYEQPLLESTFKTIGALLRKQNPETLRENLHLLRESLAFRAQRAYKDRPHLLPDLEQFKDWEILALFYIDMMRRFSFVNYNDNREKEYTDITRYYDYMYGNRDWAAIADIYSTFCNTGNRYFIGDYYVGWERSFFYPGGDQEKQKQTYEFLQNVLKESPLALFLYIGSFARLITDHYGTFLRPKHNVIPKNVDSPYFAGIWTFESWIEYHRVYYNSEARLTDQQVIEQLGYAKQEGQRDVNSDLRGMKKDMRIRGRLDNQDPNQQ